MSTSSVRAAAPRPSAVVPGGSRTVAGARPVPGHRLSLVPSPRTGAPRAPFVVLLGTLLTAGLAGLLVLHTALAEDSFRLQDVKNRSGLLADREQALAQEVAREAAPRRLAARAEALGMVRSVNPAFIRLSDGRILGRPRPGVAPAPVVPEPSAPGPSATPAPRAEASPPEHGAAR